MTRTTPLAGALLGVLLLSGCATPGSTPKGSLRDAASLHAASSLADARLPAALCATAYFWWQRGILGTIVIGMAVYLPLHIGWGW